jgi:hypothetical protein
LGFKGVCWLQACIDALGEIPIDMALCAKWENSTQNGAEKYFFNVVEFASNQGKTLI